MPRKPVPPTRVERRVLDLIESFIDTHTYSPTIREIAELLYMSSPAPIHVHLQNLEKKGYITREAGKPRTIRIRYDKWEAAA